MSVLEEIGWLEAGGLEDPACFTEKFNLVRSTLVLTEVGRFEAGALLDTACFS
jgi:hypothetical protein